MVRRQQPPRAGRRRVRERGDDEYGRRARENLAETGVDTARITAGDDPSTRSVILSDPDGERAIVTAGESFREFLAGREPAER